jgi:hypothetical protein
MSKGPALWPLQSLGVKIDRCTPSSIGEQEMRRFGIFAAFVAIILVAYIAVFNTTIRYRLTLEASADGVPKTGSGVIQVNYSKNNDPISRAEFSTSVRGEAVVLDLGPRGTLFALLKGGTDSRSVPEYIVLRAFDFPGGAFPGPITKGLSQVQHLSGKRELPLASLPLLVRFRDPNNPMTVEKVDPLDLEKSFGPGAKLNRATLEIVSSGVWPFNWLGLSGEPITNSIEQRLPWLAGTKGGYLDGGLTSRNAPLGLHGGDFKTGLYR